TRETAPARPGDARAPAVLDLAALDRIRAVQRSDRPDLVTRVLRLYLERSPEQLQAIVDAAAAADASRLARAAHALKGGSGNLGLLQIADLLGRIEQLAKQGQLAEVSPLMSRLPGVHAAAAAAVRGELERCPPSREPNHG